MVLNMLKMGLGTHTRLGHEARAVALARAGTRDFEISSVVHRTRPSLGSHFPLNHGFLPGMIRLES